MVRELAALTPGPYIHIGGDEVKTLTPADYAAFIERVQAIVTRHGKRAIGWEEIAHARLEPTTVVQHWRAGGADAMAVASAAAASAVTQGARFVMSPASKVYLDMKYDASTALGLNWAGYVELRVAYDWNPTGMFEGVTEANVLGVEAPLWTETIVTMTRPRDDGAAAPAGGGRGRLVGAGRAVVGSLPRAHRDARLAVGRHGRRLLPVAAGGVVRRSRHSAALTAACCLCGARDSATIRRASVSHDRTTCATAVLGRSQSIPRATVRPPRA